MLDALHEMNATSAAANGESEIGFAMERFLSGRSITKPQGYA
jgi:hypothetical protein